MRVEVDDEARPRACGESERRDAVQDGIGARDSADWHKERSYESVCSP